MKALVTAAKAAGTSANTVVNRMLHRRLRATLLLAFIVGSVAFSGTASAHGADLPPHASQPGTCWFGLIQTKPPLKMTSWYGNGNPRHEEYVYWRVDLYKNGPYGWQLVNGSKPTMWAKANYVHALYQGSGTWFELGTARPRYEVNFGNLSAGSYAVLETFMWGTTGVRHEHWTTYGTTGYTICNL